ncbi:hypothetical protein A6A03_02070 [Chloroflexus islandicus]|uniref:DUF11 domain-containing protein n=1 Tax=Chloroflexus islandicus TaxID=1707952 RepID=A0A178MD44_9CHLR|nr:DUF11 domain-containing protein [Chloroflexus islandicus]OAN46067.1 hypothetical protein A6A03_02070 [Chloroflexus islandicus]
MQRRITIVLLLIWAVALALPMLAYRIASAVELPPAGSPFYIQTSSSTRTLSIGDWYTNPAGGNGYHYFTLHVPCNWNPNIPVHIDLFHPDLNSTAGGGVTDEFGGTINASYTTTFEVYAVGTPLNPPTQPAPGAAGSLIQQTYNPNTIGPQWTRLYTIAAPVTCGAYILRTQTGGNADNSWRVRFGTDDDNNPATPPPANYDNPDGIEGTGDELLIGLASTSYQHDSTTVQCLTLYQYITPGQASVTFNNFDMDGQTRIRYYAPSAAYDPNALTGGIVGTLSANAVWNNGTAMVRGGDTITNPEPGWWRIVTCINRNNQFIQEGQASLLSFIELPPEPDMTIAKNDGVSVTAPGQTLTYQIQFSNQSNLTRVPPNARPGAAFNVVITDAIPAQTSFVGCSMNGLNGSCSESGGVVTFTLTDPVIAGASGTVLVTVQVNAGAAGSITNTATLNYRDQLGNQYPPVSASDTNTIPPQPLLQLSKSDGSTVTAPGQTLTYTLAFTNTGVGEARNVTLADTLPAGVSYQSCSLGSLAGSCSESGGLVTFTLTNPVAPGASGSVSITVLVTASGPATLTNTAVLNYTDSAGQSLPPVSASDSTVVPAQPLMALSKSDGSTVTAPGQTLTYTLAFTNTGVGEARNVTLADTLPAGVSYQSCSLGSLAGSCSESGGLVTFTLTNPVAPGASGSVSITVLVTASGPATLTNTAVLNYTDSAGQSLPPVSASDSTVIPDNAAVRLTKSAAIVVDGNNDGLAGSGDVIEYTLILTNTGPAVARQLVVSDTPDANTTLVTGSVTATPPAVVTQGNSAGDTAVQVTLSSLGVNASLTITFRVQVNTPLPNNVTEIVNQATVSGDNTLTTSSDDPTTTTPDDPTRLRTPPPDSPPTAIELTEFRLLPVTGGWEIRWTTGVEVNTSIFMIYRSTGGRDKASLLAVIPARGSASNGASYSVIDRHVLAGVAYSYWLVEIETNGAQHEYGPLQSHGTISQQHQYFIPLIGR